MANHMNEYINPVYLEDETPGILVPNLCPQNIKFWRGMYCRFESGVHPREPLGDLLLATCDHSHSLEDHIKYLTKKITSVKSLLLNSTEKRKSKSKMNVVLKPDDTNVLDNKYLYEKASLCQLESADDNHPLKLDNKEKERPQSMQLLENSQGVQEVIKDLDSVALDWKTLRNISECGCSTPFDHFSRKYHCRKCGDVFCIRCIDKQVILPGHLTQKAVPVCRPCYDKIQGNTVEATE